MNKTMQIASIAFLTLALGMQFLELTMLHVIKTQTKPLKPLWEYQVTAYEDSEWQLLMNTQGVLGWELVSCRRARSADDDYRNECLMKRNRRFD